MKAHNRKKRRREKQSDQPIMPVLHVNRKAQVLYVEVENPSYSREHDGASANPRKVHAAMNMRESPLVWYASHADISPAQERAGAWFRRLYEIAGGAGVQAMDYTREPVDGGFLSDGLTDAKALAGKRLAEAHQVLGIQGYKLCETVCAHGHFVNTFTRNKRENAVMMQNLRLCLDALATFWGYQTRMYGGRERVA